MSPKPAARSLTPAGRPSASITAATFYFISWPRSRRRLSMAGRCVGTSILVIFRYLSRWPHSSYGTSRMSWSLAGRSVDITRSWASLGARVTEIWHAPVSGLRRNGCIPLNTAIHNAARTPNLVAVLCRWPYCTGGRTGQVAVLHRWPYCTGGRNGHVAVLCR